MDETERLIEVDEQDRPLGALEKLAAHRAGILHRAFSIMIGDGRGRVLLQRRALGKYHAGGLWANSCCGHPRPGEDTAAAARRRLGEELGIDAALVAVGHYRYRTEVGGGLIENEFVHLFHGVCDGPLRPDPAEVMETVWARPEEIADRSRDLAPWFRLYVTAIPDFLRVGLDGSESGSGSSNSNCRS